MVCRLCVCALPPFLFLTFLCCAKLGVQKKEGGEVVVKVVGMDSRLSAVLCVRRECCV